MSDEPTPLDLEVELIASSLLPSETIHHRSVDEQRVIEIRSTESDLWLHLGISAQYPDATGVKVEVKGDSIGREEAEGWKSWIGERMADWDSTEDYPLYQLLTTHCLPLMAPTPSRSPSPPMDPKIRRSTSDVPHHILFTSHHILSPTKRKDLIALSSQLSLVGFSKIGHPGIMYAMGDREDLVEWSREVKSWNWLALRVRVGVEPIPASDHNGNGAAALTAEPTKGTETGARGGKGRGSWVELDKIADALEWLRARGRESMLLDIGMGGSGSSAR